MKRLSLHILSTFLLVINFSNAQQYNFRNYSVKEGVAQSQVYGILQDSRGYLWLGTRGGGLTRYDGTTFKTYTVKDGLVNNYVFCIEEDKNKNLWIGTNNGLSIYNGISFKNYKPTGDSSNVWMQEIKTDSKNRKWIATNVGILMFDGKEFKNISELLKLKKAVINAICVDKDGKIWFGNAEGLFCIAEKNGLFDYEDYSKKYGLIKNSITSIKQDKKGNLWIGTYGDGAYVFNGTKFFRIDYARELMKQTILDFCFDQAGNVWMASLNKGVCLYNTRDLSFIWLGEAEGLSNNHVRSIIQDKSGNFWFGTSGGGICNYFGKQFTHFDKSNGLGGNFIYSVFKDSKQRLWIGTSDKGLSVFDSSVFKQFNSFNHFLDVKVKCISETKTNQLIFGTEGFGAYYYDGTNFKQVKGTEKFFIRAIVVDAKDNTWLATAGVGLLRYENSDFEKEPEKFNVESGLLHNRLTTLCLDKTGKLWYGTENNGIGCIYKNKISHVIINQNNGLIANSIRSLHEDVNGNLWVGTAGYGISSFALYGANRQIKNYDYKSKLTSTNIYLITSDANGNIFVGTETGLDYLTIDKERNISDKKHYSKGEGFVGIETCQNSFFNEKDGTIWFGTINGLSKYNPSNAVRNNFEPITTITDVRLFYETFSKTEYASLVGDWNALQNVNLPYSQNHLSFDFLGINFSNPEAVKYQWFLDGFDKDWSPPSNQKTVTYSNLPSGDFTFKVKACNEDGVWNKTPTELKFTIETPIWMRWWFILLLVVCLSALVIGIFRWRVKLIQAKANEAQQKLQMEKELIELEQKALRLQMNPHFIFNALNSIQSQIGSDKPEEARYYLAKFSRLMRQILDNSRVSVITLQEEINTLENYLLIEKYCNGDKFDYKINASSNLELDFIKLPPMLLQPFVENAIKHGLNFNSGKRGWIEINFNEEDNYLICSVTDNGIGREKSSQLNKHSKETYHKSTALLVTKERLDLHGDVDSKNEMEIIDLFDESGRASGTKVVVKLKII